MTPLVFFQLLSAALFVIGMYGVLARRSAVLIIMSIELMLNAVNFLLVGFSQSTGSLDGQIFALMIMTVAAAEVVVGLAIILTIFRTRRDLNVDHMNVLKG